MAATRLRRRQSIPHASRPVTIALALVLVFSLGVIREAQSASRKRAKKIPKSIQYFYSLEEGLFGEKDQDAVQRLLKRADEIERPWLLMMLAQYHRTMEEDPSEGLQVLAVEVLGKKAGTKWVREFDAAERIRNTQWRNQKRNASLKRQPAPQKPVGLVTKFPEVAGFSIGPNNVQCALEAARCLMALGEIRPALSIIDAQGKAFHYEQRVLAFECLGDLYVRMIMFPKAIKSYETGLRLLKSVKRPLDKRNWLALIEKRLSQRLAETRELWDKNRFGPGYVAYRKAQTVRVAEKRLLDAFLLYGAIIEEFPKTVYAEASRNAKASILLDLGAKKTLGPNELSSIEAVRKKVLEKKAFYRRAKARKVPVPALKRIEDKIASLELKLRALKAIPYGSDAVEMAKVVIRNALADNKVGLYRGEMLISLGDFYLEQMVDAKRAATYYEQAADWFDVVKRIDKKVSLYRIPGKAQKVSRPPQKERFLDAWGNIRSSKPGSGHVFNRRTAPWYWSHYRKHVALRMGLLAFMAGEEEIAREEWGKLLSIDAFYAKCEREDRGSTYNRLMWNLDHNDGCLYGTPKEIKAFRDPSRRLMVYLADLAYENEQHEKALGIYKDLLRGKYGRPSRQERAYLVYTCFACLSWTGKPGEDVAFMLRNYDVVKRTPSEPRVLLGIANRTAATGKPKDIRGAEQYLEMLRAKCRGTQQAIDSHLISAWHACSLGRNADARKHLEKYLRMEKEGGYRAIARQLQEKMI